MCLISIRYLTFPTMDDVFPLPALLTTKQLSSSDTIERRCCLSKGYSRQWSKKLLLVLRMFCMTCSLCLLTYKWMFAKSCENFTSDSDGSIWNISSFFRKELTSLKGDAKYFVNWSSSEEDIMCSLKLWPKSVSISVKRLPLLCINSFPLNPCISLYGVMAAILLDSSSSCFFKKSRITTMTTQTTVEIPKKTI